MGDLAAILCAVDDTEPSRRAVEASRWLGRLLDASVILAHVFDPMAVLVPPAGDLTAASLASDDVVRLERERAHARLVRTAELLLGVKHVTALVEGRPVPELLRLASEHSARLLVAGAAGRAGLDRILIGSVSSELAAKAPCPVVAVPTDAELDQPGPVLAGYDGSDHSLRAARHGAALAARLGRDLVLLHVVERGDAGVSADADLAEELHAAARACVPNVPGGSPLRLTVKVAIEEGDPVARLAGAAHDRFASLVVTGARGRNAVSAALLGSVSAGLVRAARRPVVLVTPSADAVASAVASGTR